MAPSSRSPRRSAEETPYHHGDLRQALLEAAVDLLRRGGVQALTLRAVARAAGVSQAAPYRHFADRRALVASVAQEAFERMGESIGQAVQQGDRGLPALRRGMAAYVRFAQEHPAEYRVMFGAELASRENLPELNEAALGAFSILRDGIARLQQGGVLSGDDPIRVAITVWATLHGLAMLALDGQTTVTGHSIDALIDTSTELLLRGMGAKA